MQRLYLKVALPVPLYTEFDYRIPACGFAPKVGSRTLVPFGRRKLIGIITAINHSSKLPEARLKTAIKILDQAPVLDTESLWFGRWLSSYYQAPSGEAYELILPKALRKQEKVSLSADYTYFAFGKSDEVSLKLKRAPKQLKLWQYIKTKTDGVDTKLVRNNFSNYRSALNELIKKQLIIRRIKQPENLTKSDTVKTLNRQQQTVLDKIDLTGFSANLLYGVTGSGKTEVYLQLIAKVVADKKQALVLIPEISLSPQTLKRFQARFQLPVVMQHSKMSDLERYRSWLEIKTGKARILITTRSGVFNQFTDLGLIIVDEEHDSSFKQQDGIRYSARDMALVRAKHLGIPVVLGSATPALESLNNAVNGDYNFFKLNRRAGKAKPPKFYLEDLKHKKADDIFTAGTLEKISKTLEKNLQVLVFINRRGYAPVYYCNSCGHIKKCRRCDAHMIMHKNPKRLVCHHCGSSLALANICENCGSNQLLLLGHGTEKVDERLKELFPATKIIRIDRDSTSRKQSWDKLYQKINSLDKSILVGTQMLAKGHHFPNVALVVVLDADQGLLNTDFRASEHLGQLITQVAGRAGRDKHQGEVILQTMKPDNQVLQTLLNQGYLELARLLLKERRETLFPPITAMCIVRAESHDKSLAYEFLNRVKKLVKNEQVEKLGPLPAVMEKRAGKYRMQLILQAKNRKIMQNYLSRLTPKISTLKNQNRLRWSIDVDPINLF